MLTLFTLPADFVSSSTAYIGDLFTDLKAPIVLLVGISLGMWIINYVIAKFRSRAKS